MRAIICPLRTRVPRSTACSTSRPGTLTPSTTVSSAARAPVEVTMRGTRSSTAWKTLTGRGGATAAGFSVDAEAEEDAVDWPVQPAAASTTASSTNQGRGIRQMIPQNASTPPRRGGVIEGRSGFAGASRALGGLGGHFGAPDVGNGPDGRAVGTFDAKWQRQEPAAVSADLVQVGQVLDDGDARGKEHVVGRALLGRQLHTGLEDRCTHGVVGRIVVTHGLDAAPHEPVARGTARVPPVPPELLALHPDLRRPPGAHPPHAAPSHVPGVAV